MACPARALRRPTWLVQFAPADSSLVKQLHWGNAVSSILSVRLDPATSAALAAAAASSETSVSGFARNAITKALPEGAALPALPPSTPRRRVVIPEADVAAVSRLVGEVGRLTGATVQVAKALREIGRVPGHATVESVLRDIRATQTDLVRIVDRLRAADVAA
jgi:hypothetical protein